MLNTPNNVWKETFGIRGLAVSAFISSILVLSGKMPSTSVRVRELNVLASRS